MRTPWRSWTGFRSVLARDIEQFLAHKRALGRRFKTEEQELRAFDRFLVNRKVRRIGEIRPTMVEAFLGSISRRTAKSWNCILSSLSRLFRWMVAQQRMDESPLRAAPRRIGDSRPPRLIQKRDVARILEAARRLPDSPGVVLYGETYSTIYAILYALGMRVGEASSLQIKDLDLERRLLVVRNTKFGKTRLVPFGPRAEQRLRNYLDARTRSGAHLVPDAPVFSIRGTHPVDPDRVSTVFRRLVMRMGLGGSDARTRPRLHDLRHSFAISTLLRWYRTCQDIGPWLFRLSTFMGHSSISSTATYLTITGELLAEASRRFTRFASPGSLPEALS